MGLIRNLYDTIFYPGQDQKEVLNQYSEQIIQSNALDLSEANRQGQYFIACDPTARAGVVAIPTTTAVDSLMNNEAAASKKCYFLKRITAQIVANTAAASFGIVVNLQRLVASAGSDVKRVCLAGGQGVVNTNAIIANAQTAVAADCWVPIGNTAGNSVASGFGTSFDSGDLEGMFVIRPQRQLHAAMVASATNVTAVIYFHWIERIVDNLIG